MSEPSVAEFLRHVPLLAEVPDELRAQLADRARGVRVAAGEWLFHEGDAGDSAFVVHTGRLEVVADGTAIREIKRGGVIGELALLRSAPRAASVRAKRDAHLLEVRREDFEALMTQAPAFALALTRTLAQQLAEVRTPSNAHVAPATIAVLGLDAAAPAGEVAYRLATQLERYGRLARLREADDLATTLEQAERRHDRVLLDAGVGAPGDPWTEGCLREADLVVAVASLPVDRRWLARASALAGCELFTVGGTPGDDELAALAPRQTHARRDAAALGTSVDALARRLTGRSLGLVLSGGGARAFAHLGVLEELTAAGLHFDRVAGVSLGSVVAGSIAMGLAPEEIYARFCAEFLDRNPSNDYTLPAVSVLRGIKTRRALAQLFGDVRIEELERSFFCLSCDLMAREAVVHRSGPLQEAVYASLAIPGVFPPVVPREGQLLVDGGVLDNLPVAIMARSAEGPVVASDVTSRDGRWAGRTRGEHDRLARRLRSALTGSEDPLPRLGETLFRTFTLGSADTAAAARAHADLVVVPQVDGVGLMDWKQLPRLRDAGRAAAAAALDQQGHVVARWRSDGVSGA